MLNFYAVDSEFAASTGSNVNANPNWSIFDYPPNGSKDLVVSTLPGDTDPRLFETGDRYSVAWGGQGGGGQISDAVVIRSDAAPGDGGGGIIVFEGIDDQGNLAQIVWTPGFDLEGWYWDNYTPSDDPAFYTYDTNPSYDHSYVCFAAEAQIETADGPMPAGSLRPGQRVLTLDAGPQVIRWVGGKSVLGHGPGAPVRVRSDQPGRADLRLSQQHRVMIADPQAEMLFGHPEVFVPAKALAGRASMRLAPCAQVTYVHVLLDQHHILIAEGVACESLFLGQLAGQHVPVHGLPRRLKQRIRHVCAARPILTYREARLLVAALPPAAVTDAGRVA